MKKKEYVQNLEINNNTETLNMTFNTQYIDFSTTKTLNSLVHNYINEEETIKPFYTNYPNTKGFTDVIKTVSNQIINRDILVNELKLQNNLVLNTNQATVTNTDLLLNKNCFTITTGHQLCLFTGPLYFIYKIFSAINLAQALKKQFPENDFVPVYWMASEDHDFEEINNFNLFGKNIQWQSSQTGAVGNFNTSELKLLLPQLKQILGETPNANYLYTLFEQAYTQTTTLKNATRFLVNQLFGSYGLVVLDGNAVNLKKQFIPQFKDDIFNTTAFTTVNQSIQLLQHLGYKTQVNPRPINCFYMEDGIRARIEKQDDNYLVIGTNKKFTAQQLEQLINTNPEKISPNVVLRPLYQQHILPNIAYVGGPGELAYWLQYKTMFAQFNITYPVLVPRTFITVIENNIKNKLQKLNFTEVDMFKDEQDLIKEFQINENAIFDLEEDKKNIELVFNNINAKINTIDKTLSATVNAEQQKALTSLDVLTTKANKALKQKLDTEITQIKTLKQKLFPNGMPQERFENFAIFYLKYGNAFFTQLKEIANPLVLKHIILSEE